MEETEEPLYRNVQLSRSKAIASLKKKPDVGKYDMRDKKQHTLYLQTVLMKRPGPVPQY